MMVCFLAAGRAIAGGALYQENSISSTLGGCWFQENESQGDGGAVFQAMCVLAEMKPSENCMSLLHIDGVIWCFRPSFTFISTSAFVGNKAAGEGGGGHVAGR